MVKVTFHFSFLLLFIFLVFSFRGDGAQNCEMAASEEFGAGLISFMWSRPSTVLFSSLKSFGKEISGELLPEANCVPFNE